MDHSTGMVNQRARFLPFVLAACIAAVSCGKVAFQCDDGLYIPVEGMCNGKTDCLDSSDETESLCNTTTCPVLSYRCHYGACIPLNRICDGNHDCADSSDENEELCLNQNKNSCYPPRSPRMTVHCTAGNSDTAIPCTYPVPVGTKIHYKCRRFYVPNGPEHVDNSETECVSPGHWKRNVLRCKPECGKLGEEVTPLIVNGREAPLGTYSWQVALYKWQAKQWNLICGGSLISEYAVITAAHCVWKANTTGFRLAFGKYFRDYNRTQEITQIRNVSKVALPVAYQDKTGNYGSDVAILILESPVEFTDSIRPVCIDWKQEFVDTDLKEGNFGTILGWGVNENDSFSNSLRITQLQVASDEVCIKDQPKDFKKYVTYTSFCAGFRNGTGVCNGDSGGGLMFLQPEHNDSWVIQGVVSVSPRRRGTTFCDPRFYTVFTKVSIYVKWIYGVLANSGFEI